MDQSQSVYSEKSYKRSRNAYKMECTFEYFVTLLIADAYLAKVLSSIGMSDALIGIVSSFVSLAFLFQLAAVFVVQRISNTKRFVTIFHTLSQLFFVSLYLVPFLPFASEYKQVLAMACIIFGYFGNYFVTMMIFKWGNSFVDPEKRGSFSAGKEMISLASGIVVTLLIGYAMDAFEAAGNQSGAFIFIAVAIFIFCLSDFVCLMMIKNRIQDKNEPVEKIPFTEVVRNTLGKKNYRRVLYLASLRDIARYMTVGFLGIYRIQELALTLGMVQVINMIGALSRFLMSKPFGKYSDKTSYAKGLELALLIVAVAHVAVMFTTPTTWFFIILYSVLSNIGNAGTNSNFHNIMYSYVDEKYFVQASAIKNSVAGVLGFLAALVASSILSAVQANGNKILGMTVYAQQLLAFISFVLYLLCFLYIHFVISKQKVIKQ